MSWIPDDESLERVFLVQLGVLPFAGDRLLVLRGPRRFLVASLCRCLFLYGKLHLQILAGENGELFFDFREVSLGYLVFYKGRRNGKGDLRITTGSKFDPRNQVPNSCSEMSSARSFTACFQKAS